MKRIFLFTLMAAGITSHVRSQTTWGLGNTRTEVKNDATHYDTSSKSGFYQTSSPVNYPTTAPNDSWLMLEVRQSNIHNQNLAMQFSGNAWDRNLYFRKTLDHNNQWSKVIMETLGKVKIDTTLEGPGGIKLESFDFGRASWIDLPTTGASGIGSNGAAGRDAWIGYSSANGMYFDNALMKDICYRNINGRLLFGNVQATPGMVIKNNKIGIGEMNPQEALSVNGNISSVGNLRVDGNIISKKVRVTQNVWADYVFEPSYKLLTLKQVEDYITRYRHLPDVPSARQVEEDGLDIGTNQATLLRKIEETLLYIIEQNKKLEKQQKQIEAIQKEIRQSRK